jgi:hypothetical protein
MNVLRSSTGATIIAMLTAYSAFAQTYAINTFAGGYLPNNISAVSAVMGVPSGIAIDSAGDVFFATSLNAVFKLSAGTGILTLVAGNGTYGFSGDSGLAINAELYFEIFSATNGVAVAVWHRDHWMLTGSRGTGTGAISVLLPGRPGTFRCRDRSGCGRRSGASRGEPVRPAPP